MEYRYISLHERDALSKIQEIIDKYEHNYTLLEEENRHLRKKLLELDETVKSMKNTIRSQKIEIETAEGFLDHMWALGRDTDKKLKEIDEENKKLVEENKEIITLKAKLYELYELLKES